MLSSSPIPRVGFRTRDRVLPAIPLALRGDRASLVLPDVPLADGDTHVILNWDDGAVTELRVRVHAIEACQRIAHLEVQTVEGDWKPFLAFLGTQTA